MQEVTDSERRARTQWGKRIMITNKTRAEMVEVSAKLITDRLSRQAHEQVIENFCLLRCGCTPDGKLLRCGCTPDGELCVEAEMVHRLFVAMLFKWYSGLN